MIFHLMGLMMMQILMLCLVIIYIRFKNSSINLRESFNKFLHHQTMLIDNLTNQKISLYFKIIVFLVISTSIFHSFLKTVMANAIKTSKIIVDTSSLILTKTDLINTYRNVCWMHGEIDLEIFRDSREESFKHEIWLKKNSEPVCTFKKTSPGVYLDLFKTYFMITKRTAILMMMQMFYKFIPYKM